LLNRLLGGNKTPAERFLFCVKSYSSVVIIRENAKIIYKLGAEEDFEVKNEDKANFI